MDPTTAYKQASYLLDSLRIMDKEFAAANTCGGITAKQAGIMRKAAGKIMPILPETGPNPDVSMRLNFRRAHAIKAYPFRASLGDLINVTADILTIS